MKTYKINELTGAVSPEVYREAICNVIWNINCVFGNNLFFGRDDAQVDMLAERLGIRFDEEGNIVK